MISFQNILDGQGFALTFAGMVIVFAALIVLTLFITLLPKVLGLLQARFPSLSDGEASSSQDTQKNDVILLQIVAAIAFAKHRYQATIKR